MSQVTALVNDVLAARKRVLGLTAALSSAAGDDKPGPDEWSPAQVVEHLVHAEQGGILMMWKSLEWAKSGGRVWQGDHPDRDQPIEVLAEKHMKPKEKAPESAQPRIGGPIGYWNGQFEATQVILERFAEELGDGELDSQALPHFLMGPMTTRQRLEFLRWHIVHHIPQLERLIEPAA